MQLEFNIKKCSFKHFYNNMKFEMFNIQANSESMVNLYSKILYCPYNGHKKERQTWTTTMTSS